MKQAHPDQQLILALLHQDHKGIQTIYQRCAAKVKGWICSNSGTDSDAADMMQEALMALVHRARKGGFTLTCPIDQYVLIIVRSLWLNALRADKRKPVTFIDNRLLPDMNADDQHEAEHIAAEHLRWEIFQHHLSLMPQRCQDIIKGSLSGESMQELAQQLDIDYGYLRRKKHDCLQELIKRIEADERYQQEDLA